MKLDHQKLQAAYLETINKICDDCEDKTHFGIQEIVSIIVKLINSGQFYLPPSKTSVLELYEEWKKLSPEWTAETKEFVDELYSRLEWAETEVSIFQARLKGEWTPNSKLYTQQELDHQCLLSYNGGLADGLDQAASSHDIGFRPQD